jgi:hypothetical protein
MPPMWSVRHQLRGQVRRYTTRPLCRFYAAAVVAHNRSLAAKKVPVMRKQI